MKKIQGLILFALFLGTATMTLAQEPPCLRRNQSFLGIHFDFHALNECTDIGKNTTPEMVNAVIDMVHPDYIEIDGEGQGWASYPTKVSTPAPCIVGDPLRIWREVTAKCGVALYLHMGGVHDPCALEQYPEWAATLADGTRVQGATSVFGSYADLRLIPQLKELAGDYGLDGVWVDGDCLSIIPDYSERAVRLFRETTGINDIPKSDSEPHWYEWMQFHREAFLRYLRHYVSAVKSEYPDFQICSAWAFSHHMPEPVSAPLDFISGDLWTENCVNTARLAGRFMACQGVTWDLMPWGFSSASSKPPFELKSAVQLNREAAVFLALGGGLQVYYTQNRDGSVRLEEMKEMAEVAKFARTRQPWCHHSSQVPQVALLLSTSEYKHNTRCLFPNYLLHEQGILGWLLEGHNSVDVVNEETLGVDMSRFPLIVIPEWQHISPSFRTDLVDYAKEGGNLLVIGSEASAQFAALADVRLEGNETVIQPLGKGKIGFLPWSVGEEFGKRGNEALRKDVNDAARTLFPNPIVEVSGSPRVDVSVSQLNGKRMVHLVNTSGDHAKPIIRSIEPVGSFQLSIRCDRKPSKITLQPADKTCDFTYANGKATVKIDAVEIYDILVVE